MLCGMSAPPPADRRHRTLALATPHAAATQAGLEAFAAGGNAIDAMVAACAAVAVAYPHMVTIGGDAFALMHTPDGRVIALNGSGAAPRATNVGAIRATRDTMLPRAPETITVPGVLATLDTLRSLGGRLTVPQSLAPAIALAADGVAVSRSLAAALVEYGDIVAADPGLSSVFVVDGRPLAEGDTFRQPTLAATLEHVAARGTAVFYGGEIGERFVAGLREHGSVLALADLAAHRTEVGTPIGTTALGIEALVPPPNSQGFMLLETLMALERLGGWIDPLGPGAATLAALFALAIDDRDRRLGDPRSGAAAIDDLLGVAHATELAEAARRWVAGGVPADHATTARGASVPDGAAPSASPDTSGSPGGHRHSGDTVGMACADSEGYAVAVMASLYDLFGVGVLEPETGIICHDRGACFSLDPGSPNLLAPGARPAHTLTPLMVRRDGRLWAVAGSMGGYAQPQIHTQILYHILAAGLDPQAAVAAPRWTLDVDYSGSPALKLWVEATAPTACRSALSVVGLPVEVVPRMDEWVGQAQYVVVDSGRMIAATDPRADGLAACEAA